VPVPGVRVARGAGADARGDAEDFEERGRELAEDDVGEEDDACRKRTPAAVNGGLRCLVWRWGRGGPATHGTRNLRLGVARVSESAKAIAPRSPENQSMAPERSEIRERRCRGVRFTT